MSTKQNPHDSPVADADDQAIRQLHLQVRVRDFFAIRPESHAALLDEPPRFVIAFRKLQEYEQPANPDLAVREFGHRNTLLRNLRRILSV